MSVVMKVVFSLSLSGSLLILVLLLCKPLYRNRLGRQWQYYIWLVVIARLLLPVAPEGSLVGMLFSQTGQAYQTDAGDSKTLPASTAAGEAIQNQAPWEDTITWDYESDRHGAETAVFAVSVKDVARKLPEHFWIVWLVIALLLLVRRITVYQSFVKYIKAGRREISDVALLDRLAQTGALAGVRRPVELYSNSLVSSPLLIGFFRPCIILPKEHLPEEDFTCIVWHELTHFRRKDLFYKWLVQLTICLHWFNPLVWLMGWEINRDCEFACDEAVLAAIGEQKRRAYGDTLLRAMETGGNYRNFPVSVTLNESAALLKERLGAIMVFRKRSKAVMMVSAVLTGVMLMGATAAGAYVEPVRTAGLMTVVPQAAPGGLMQTDIEGVRNQSTGQQKSSRSTEDGQNEKSFNELAEQYYQMGLYVQFEAVFSALDETAQKKWLDTIYADDNIAFFSVAFDGLRSSSPLIGEYMEKSYADKEIAYFAVAADELSGSNPLLEAYAERAYADDRINFFAVLVDNMSTELLKSWQARAADEEMGIDFKSVLMDTDVIDDEMKTLVEDAQREAEEQYQKWGITVDGDDYYYQGQLVHLFYDKYDGETVIRTIQINPLGTVDVQVTRNIRNKITGVNYMTEEEVTELFGTDISSRSDGEEDKQEMKEKDGKLKEKAHGIENDIYRLKVEELPEAVQEQVMDDSAGSTWYVYRCGRRQYLWYKDFAWTYAYQPTYDDAGWRIDIERLRQKNDGDILLSLPGNGHVTVYCDGQEVQVTEIEE